MEDNRLIIIAIMFAIIGIVGAGIQYLKGITCENCNFTGNTTFDEIKVNTIGKNSNNSINFSTNYIILNNETGFGTVFKTKSGHVTLSFIDDIGDSTFSYEGTSDISNLHSSWRVDSAGITFVRDDSVNFTSFAITTLGVQITCPAGNGVICIS